MTPLGFPDSSVGKESTRNAGDPGSIPGLGRSPGEGLGYPLQYSDLENSMDCIVQGVTKSWTQLSYFHFFMTLLTNSEGFFLGKEWIGHYFSMNIKKTNQKETPQIFHIRRSLSIIIMDCKWLGRTTLCIRRKGRERLRLRP